MLRRIDRRFGGRSRSMMKMIAELVCEEEILRWLPVSAGLAGAGRVTGRLSFTDSELGGGHHAKDRLRFESLVTVRLAKRARADSPSEQCSHSQQAKGSK
jgi:hypothetical protein